MHIITILCDIEYECSVDELKKLHSVVEKERRELSAVLCDLSVTGMM